MSQSDDALVFTHKVKCHARFSCADYPWAGSLKPVSNEFVKKDYQRRQKSKFVLFREERKMEK